MGFFTDQAGEMAACSYADTGENAVYPAPGVEGEAYVRAAYNPVSDRLLLTWTESNGEDYWSRSYLRSYYRIIDSDGKFLTEALPVSEPKTSFQGNSDVIYNSVDNKFLLVWADYKLYFDSWYYLYCIEGKLWARSIDDEGNFLDKKQKPKSLINRVQNKHTGLFFTDFSNDLAFNPDNNEYFITYRLIYFYYYYRVLGRIDSAYRFVSYCLFYRGGTIWGLIY